MQNLLLFLQQIQKNLNAIRFQLQTGKSTVSSAVKVSEDVIGVKKAEAFVALQTLYTTTVVISFIFKQFHY